MAIVCAALFLASYSAGIAATSFPLIVELVLLPIKGVEIGLSLLMEALLF